MGDEVKGYEVSYLARNRERLQQSLGCGVDRLGRLAGDAAINEVLDRTAESWPIEYAAEAGVGPLYPRMSSYDGGVIIG